MTVLTCRILIDKAFNSDINETWKDWAIEMLESGFLHDSLYELAGIELPYNQWKLQELTDRVLDDLRIDFRDTELTIRKCACFLIARALNGTDSYFSVLEALKDICVGLDMLTEYMDFYLLYFAKCDLESSENQWYWDGANRGNIDAIIEQKFRDYIDNDCRK